MPTTTSSPVTCEERGTRRVNGADLYCEVWGRGAPILCIHGTGSSALAWEAAVPRLAGIGRVISYDRRGFSRSGPADASRPVPVAQHADDAAALLDALRAAPAVVVGRSYGGYVAIDMALRHPDHVRALVLLEGAPESLDPEAETWVHEVVGRILAAGAAGPEAAAEALWREVLGDAGWDRLPEETRRMVRGNGEAILAELGGDWLPAGDPEGLAAIAQPALIVTAAESPPAFRRANQRAAAAIPNARMAEVGGGHMVDPAEPAVLAFLAEVLA